MGKIDQLREMAITQTPDIMFIYEAEIRKHHPLDMLQIKNYSIELSNTEHSKIHRMVAYVKNTTKFERILEPKDSNVMLFKNHCNSDWKIITGLYRTFKIIDDSSPRESFKKQLDFIQDNWTVNRSAVLVGDFNLDFLKRNDRACLAHQTARYLPGAGKA